MEHIIDSIKQQSCIQRHDQRPVVHKGGHHKQATEVLASPKLATPTRRQSVSHSSSAISIVCNKVVCLYAMVSPAASAPHNRQQTIQSYPPLLAPLASVFNILNWIAFVGWCYILYQLISFYLKSSPVDDKNGSYDGGAALQLLLQGTKSTLILLEGICVVEVGRIFFKDLPGNLTCK